MRRSVFTLLIAAGCLAVAVLAPDPASAAARLRVGGLVLHRCTEGARWWCGSLRRPLDPRRPAGARIAIHFRWRSAGDGAVRGPVLVATEGGPGYPSSASAVDYVGLYGPLLRARAAARRRPRDR